MPYELRKSDGTVLGTIGDGIADNSKSSLTFIGKNLSNFGKLQNENFLHLLENFADNTEPLYKLNGQTWYDTDNYVLKLYTGGDTWVSLSIMDASGTAPTSGHAGYLWFDTTNKQLSVNDGSTYTLIGPERVEGYGVTKFSSTKLLDTNLANHAVIKLLVDNEVVGVISTATFFVHSSNAISGFSTVKRGINLKYQSNDFPILGVAHNSNLSTTATNLLGGSYGSIPVQSSSGITSFVSVGSTNTVLYSNGTVPEWRSLSNISAANATTATNLGAGTQGALPYQSAWGVTSFLPLDAEGYVLTAGATRPKWLPLSGLAAGTALTATNSTRLLNGTGTAYLLASTSSYVSTIVERDDNANIWAHNVYATNAFVTTATAQLFDGVASSAQYADLAEKYITDKEYEPGTVVMVSYNEGCEVEACTVGRRAIGVVSTNPGFMMNKDLEGGTYIALKGRVPVKVTGIIKKGMGLYAGPNGTAIAGGSDGFAIALESNNSEGVKIIEALVL